MSIRPERQFAEIEAGLDALRVGFALVDADGVIQYTNVHFTHIFPDAGFVEGVKTTDLAMRLSDDVVKGLTHWLECREDPATLALAGPFDLTLKDGRVIELKERPREDGGRVLLASDVSELRKQSARLSDVIGASSDGFAFFDTKGGIDLWNDEFAIAMGDASGELTRGATVGAVLARARACGRIELIGDPPPMDLVDPDAKRRDFILRHRDSRELRLRVRPSQAGGAVAVVTDITAQRAQSDAIGSRAAALSEQVATLRATRERLRMQTASLLGLKEELFQARRDADAAERDKKSFMRALTHELRTPLNSIIGYADAFELSPHGPIGAPEYLEYVRNIGRAGRMLLAIIKNILDVTRIDSGVDRLVVDPTEIAPSVHDLIAERSAAADGIGVRIETTLPDDLPPALVDEGALQAMIENLLDNALEHTKSGGRISVTAQAANDEIKLAVEDTGCGIAPHDLARVMLPFEKAGSSEADSANGVGLGLPIVKALTEAFGGAFDISSTLGQGTKASITLRAAPRQSGSTAAA